MHVQEDCWTLGEESYSHTGYLDSQRWPLSTERVPVKRSSSIKYVKRTGRTQKWNVWLKCDVKAKLWVKVKRLKNLAYIKPRWT